MSDSKSLNLTRRATYELRQRIIHGALPGGTRLYEVALAEDMQLSRTPLREAMSRLAAEGLLERAPGGGFVVRAFSLRDVADAIELRGVLEGTAARLAAERGAPAEALASLRAALDQLDGCFDAAGEAVDFDAYSELNARFHARLAALCGSPVIEREIERVTSLPFASPSAFVLGRAEAARSLRSLAMAQAQHRALVEAIERREGARAEAIAREHARIALQNLAAAFGPGAHEAEPVPGLSLIRR